jgi:hypothetical protein
MVTVADVRKSFIDPANLPEMERATLRRILGTMSAYRREVFAALAVMFVCALLNLLPPLLIKRTVDQAIPAGDETEVLELCGLMIVGPLIAGLLQVWQKYLTAFVGERVMLDLRTQLYEHLQKQPVGYFTTARPGEALSRVLNDVPRACASRPRPRWSCRSSRRWSVAGSRCCSACSRRPAPRSSSRSAVTSSSAATRRSAPSSRS